MARVSQEAGILGDAHLQALVSPVASNLMSNPLRKRIRSPDLRAALSAGLPESKKRGCWSVGQDLSLELVGPILPWESDAAFLFLCCCGGTGI
jgi:hypothetical protein